MTGTYFNLNPVKKAKAIQALLAKITHRFMIKFFFFTTLILLSSCRFPTNFGFYQPLTLDTNVPDGPPEFKAGWRDGCRSGMANGTFLNSAVYLTKSGPSFSPVYTHDPQYRSGWSTGYWICGTYSSSFVSMSPMQRAPLD
ncbi:MAG: hypothetical protein KGP29_07330 [Proteobacteria bacterium]|nr:hypothetical protein [Pseudomonadota bacterium]